MKQLKMYLIICSILYPLIFTVKYFNYELGEKILVPLFVTIVLAFNTLNNPPHKNHNIYLLFAFLFVCIGDYLVNLTKLGGIFIIPFILVHASLITYFSKEKPWKKDDIYPLIGIVIGMIVFQFSVIHLIDKFSFKIVFVLYTLLLSTMLWRASCYARSKDDFLNKFLIMGGAFLFLVTDVCVALNIVLKTNLLIAVTWICYVPTLVMLSLMNLSFKK